MYIIATRATVPRDATFSGKGLRSKSKSNPFTQAQAQEELTNPEGVRKKKAGQTQSQVLVGNAIRRFPRFPDVQLKEPFASALIPSLSSFSSPSALCCRNEGKCLSPSPPPLLVSALYWPSWGRCACEIKIQDQDPVSSLKETFSICQD